MYMYHFNFLFQPKSKSLKQAIQNTAIQNTESSFKQKKGKLKDESQSTQKQMDKKSQKKSEQGTDRGVCLEVQSTETQVIVKKKKKNKGKIEPHYNLIIINNSYYMYQGQEFASSPRYTKDVKNGTS